MSAAKKGKQRKRRKEKDGWSEKALSVQDKM